MDMTLIATAGSALSAAFRMGRGAVEIRDAVKLAEVMAAMNEKLLDAQQSLFAHGTELASLQQKYLESTKELAEVREALAERGRYTLVSAGDSQFAYLANRQPELGRADQPGGAEPAHYICQPCFDGAAKRRVVLQKAWGRGQWTRECPACKTQLRMGT